MVNRGGARYHEPSPAVRTPDVEGYRNVQIVATEAQVAPLIAPKTFALRLADLGVA